MFMMMNNNTTQQQQNSNIAQHYCKYKMSELEAIQEEEAVELGEDTKGEEGPMLLTRKTLLAPKFKDEKGLRGNIFCTTFFTQNKVCNLIIDGGSCENVVSQ